MQRPEAGSVAQRAGVSILTRPEGRVQRVSAWHWHQLISSFNPHPARGSGATWGCFMPMGAEVPFQSSPGPRVGCNSPGLFRRLGGCGFNPHPARGSGATRGRSTASGAPEQVSILTRPEGRVQRARGAWGRGGARFQSSPGPRVGCNQPWIIPSLGRMRFQSSPGPRVGCNTTIKSTLLNRIFQANYANRTNLTLYSRPLLLLI